METKIFLMIYSAGPRNRGDAPEGTYTENDYGGLDWKLNVVAFEGTFVVTCERDEFWGGDGSKAYRSKVMTNPTWGQLYECAKAQQKKTLDMHHSFFEGAYKSGVENDIGVLRLSLGS